MDNLCIDETRVTSASAHTQPPADSLTRLQQQSDRNLDNDVLLERQQQRESNARSYPRRLPLALVRGHGIYVEDSRGQLYIDALAAAGTLALGHHHPDIQEAIRQTLGSGIPMQTLDLTTPVKDEFIERLFALLPAGLQSNSRVQFCSPCGADAVEAAIKLAKTATGRHNVIAFAGAYHGMTQGTLSLMGNLGPKRHLGTTVPGVQFLPYPHARRCPYGLGAAGVQASLNQLESMLTDPESGVLTPAAIIVEAVQGEAGALPADLEWLRGLRRLTRQHGIALILDEVQAGMGRTGQIFAFQHAGIEPDMIVLSKAIGGGLPLALMVYHQDWDTWQPGAHAGTFRGNQLAMATGQVVMNWLHHNQLHLHAGQMGERLLTRLRQIHSPIIGEVRGRGLMIGVEIVDPEQPQDALGNHPLDGQRARQIQREALTLGLITEVGGRHGSTVRLLPPLIINETEVDAMADILSEAILRAGNQ
ncbi:diaminobutyrate--2-oxoglutarate transaminase [Gynuella sunshinyii]|uniref:4-aminobutyrate aminotransferase and related aminotransferase n=1 Tax=Gynuella sunshinyii YC6258 TaxID=1445510 RepID=A0A0C5VMD0_9GAMM|nr:diaminobutyrate--2-oxoglutarate transaminase [Gynuella sunshinyii]AJQ95471.1 4-aminobutyrate aminotransferase and related aminotransferase [Gynuella sunshinyii YC6258]